MLDRTAITQLIDSYLLDGPLFLIDVIIKPGNIILVFLDSDKEVTINDCARTSKHIESNLNRDEEDYELRVSSAGIDHPYKYLRQYIKNQGRKVQVLLTDGTTVNGVLTQANDQFIEVNQREEGKKKTDQKVVTRQIPFDQIKETKGIISFD